MYICVVIYHTRELHRVKENSKVSFFPSIYLLFRVVLTVKNHWRSKRVRNVSPNSIYDWFFDHRRTFIRANGS